MPARRRPPDYTARDWIESRVSSAERARDVEPAFRSAGIPRALYTVAWAIVVAAYAVCLAVAHHRHPQRPGFGDDDDDD